MSVDPPCPPRRAARPTRAERRRAGYVTGCQQLLALGVVLAALTPAAAIVTLDVVPADPTASGAALTAAPSTGSAQVPTGPVDARVHEVALTAPRGARLGTGALHARRTTGADGRTELTSTPQPVTGYGTVGVTWAHGTELDDHDVALTARTREGGRWSAWGDLDYHDEHGPDPSSAEYAGSRPGSDELVVGDVDAVQVRMVTEEAVPADVRLAVVDPGAAAGTRHETAAARSSEPPAQRRTTASVTEATPQPAIFSRRQWGADERLRDAGSLRFGEVHAGFVHHTVNANDYAAADVPAILRGIYAYHTRSRGWSDVGYNYLVDRFGRIWEGRAGGIDRPVVGAHTLGYNDDAFAMSAIGNYETAQPSAAMLQAYGALFAWKLSLHGITPTAKRQRVADRTFPAINGHRDAGSTACPGRHLYAKLPQIRSLAAQAQRGFAGRQLSSNVVGGGLVDLVARRAADGQAVVVPLDTTAAGATVARSPIEVDLPLADASQVLRPGDWDGDGVPDLLTRSADGSTLLLHRGLGRHRFAEPTTLSTDLRGVVRLAAAGDVTGDGRPDLTGRRGQAMHVFPGRPRGLRPSFVMRSSVPGRAQVPVGLWDKQGAPDLLMREGASRLVLYPGNGPGGLMAPKSTGIDVTGYDWVVGVRDVAGGRRADLVVRGKTDGRLWLLPTGTDDTVAPRQLLGTGFDAYDLVG